MWRKERTGSSKNRHKVCQITKLLAALAFIVASPHVSTRWRNQPVCSTAIGVVEPDRLSSQSEVSSFWSKFHLEFSSEP